ncbi:MAG TPA: UvrD-helicase domain-containing protein [Bryobacteraceae bacterium]|jgi:DNA helicase-2/ATP-dependent DNA helicase PcrA
MDFLQGLNPEQREAVEHVEGPLLILAGAGSGKTRVITHRMAHLVRQHHVPGPSILAVTFTNKASGEMRERVQHLLGEPTVRNLPLVSTFHSFCVRMLRRDGANLAQVRPRFTTQFNIYDESDQLSVVKSVFRNLGLDEKQFMQARAALSRISHAKNHKETPTDFLKKATDPNSSRLAVVYEQYEGALRNANALDFDDLLLESVRLLRVDNELRDRYNRRFEFMMVDEYQDTNSSQYELMRLLTERENVCVVGDEDQSIYSWRGANIRNILDFQKDFHNAKVIRLEENYRSVKNVLDAASAVVAKNTARLGKKLWTKADSGDLIGLYEAGAGEDEALFIADTIDRLLKRSPMERVAVLYRTNSQSRQIEEALRRYGRKYIVLGGLSFYERAEIKDILCYLKALRNPTDTVSMQRIINVPARGIGKSTVEQIELHASQTGRTFWHALEDALEARMFPARADAAVAAFHRVMNQLRIDIDSRPVDAVIRDILALTGYQKMLEVDKNPESEGRLANLQELLNAAADSTERGDSLGEFLDHAALVADSDALDEKAQISLLTMHNAKGLEWPVVFIAGLEEGLFPHSRSLENEEALEEERRLCYVALTRAQKKLFLTWALTRRRYGGGAPEASIPSRFLEEIPKHLTERLDDKGARDQVDLFAERREVRDTVKKNLFTGKTYNSVDNISQFFSDRGMPAPRGIVNAPRPPAAPQPAAAPPPPPVARPPIARPSAPPAGAQGGGRLLQMPLIPRSEVETRQPVQAPVNRPPAAPPRMMTPRPKRPFGPGSVVEHPRYGRGTVLKREGDGDDAKLTVTFPGHGLKKLFEKFAGLKIES